MVKIAFLDKFGLKFGKNLKNKVEEEVEFVPFQYDDDHVHYYAHDHDRYR
jgi:hypothetical protein